MYQKSQIIWLLGARSNRLGFLLTNVADVMFKTFLRTRGFSGGDIPRGTSGRRRRGDLFLPLTRGGLTHQAVFREPVQRILGLPQSRSEERRVGKEGRSRWSPDH